MPSSLIAPTVLLAIFALMSIYTDDTSFSKKIDIGGRSLFMNCSARPDGARGTLILEAGLNQGTNTWRSVQSSASRFARVCSYDRAGVGQSDPAGTRQRSSRQIVEDLHLLLKRSQVSPPYILVGHSFGGVVVRLYASSYPQEVAGMVLVDSVHEEETDELMKILPGDVRKAMESSGGDRVLGGEPIDLVASFNQMKKVRWRTHIPLKVIARGRASFAPDNYAPLLRPFAEQGEALRVRMQNDLAARSTKGELIFAEGSGHMIHLDQPELVVDALRRVIAETKDSH